MNSTTSLKVVIVGGGVNGLLTARQLAISNAQVTVLERRAPGRESSWAGGGILSPLQPWQMPAAITALCQWSRREFPGICEELRLSSDVDPQCLHSGMLTVLPEDEESSAEAWCLQHQEPFLWLDEKGVQGLVPGYSGGHTRALWLPEVRQVRNPRLMQALLKDVLQRGIQIVDGQAVGEFQLEDGRVAFVSTPQGRFHADQFIICAGAWSGILSLDTGLEIPISPVRGQMLAYQVPEELLRPILQCNGRYLIPRREGVLLAGSTVENVGFDASTSLDAFSNLNAFALRSLPSLASCPVIGHWAGLRPGSPLGVPIIGLHPQLSNLWFNCGHFRNGLVMAPASAHLLKDLILGNPLSLDPSPYLPQSEVV